MPRKNTILRRITIILLALLSPAFALAQSAQTLPYEYGFETDLAAAGWTLVNPDQDGESNYYITAGISTAYHNSGSNSFVFYTAGGSVHDAYLISPELSITEAARMVFYFRKQDVLHAGTFKIGTSTTGNNPSDFTTWSDEITTTPIEFATSTFSIDPGVKYVAFWFYSQNETDPRSLVLDDIRITPKCDDASNFHYTKISMRSVSLAWDDNSEGMASYKVKNGNEVVATVAAGEETNCVINGLNPNTRYILTLYTYCDDDPRTNTMQLDFTTVTGPVVEGYVCGGGRMADVRGSSRVTVANCGHLYAVYGGNDIAGEVKAEPGKSHYGTDEDAYRGAEVIVGTENTEQVLIDYVYGGGSGLYYYPGIGTETTQLNNNSQTTIQEITYVNGSPLGSEYNRTIYQDTVLKSLNTEGYVLGYYPTGDRLSRGIKYAKITADDGNYPTLPKVERTRIFVNSDNVYIDSLFGGAENAQVGKDVVNANAPADTSVSITINKGTVFALFGGNNYGGFLGKGTNQHVVVNDTKKNTSSSLNLGGDMATGKSHNLDLSLVDGAHGIRYLFGGGNDVMARNVHIEIKGGQIDTLFAGGNSADVASTTVEVKVPVNKSDPAANKSLYTSYNDVYSDNTSVFDIRCLFGGNNDANMYSVPTINITSGGIHNLYGGGNNGLMLGGELYADNDAVYENGTSAAANAYRSTKIEVDGSVVVDTIYGGGQSAGTINDTYIHLFAGTFGTVFGGTNILGNIGYQGTDGLGRNASGTHYAKTNILVDKDDEVYIKKALFGGSNGYYMCPTADGSLYTSTPMFYNDTRYTYLSNKRVPSVWQTNIWLKGGYLEGKVYGGGNLATIGAMVGTGVTLQSEGNTNVLITGCQMETDILHNSRAIFGGSNYANVYGNSTIRIVGDFDDYDYGDWYPNIAGDIYGGNDKAGTVTGGPSRTGFFSTEPFTTDVSWDSLPSYMKEDLNVTNHNVELSSSNAASLITIEGFVNLYKIFGGGNGEYDYYSYNPANGNPVYETSNSGLNDALFISDKMIKPNQTSSFIDVSIDMNNSVGYIENEEQKYYDGTIPFIYGGGNYATVGDDVTIGSKTFTGGRPTVWLNCEGKYDNDGFPEVDYLFGGNNHVDMSAVPRIYLLKGSVGEVYGGGNEGGMTGDLAIFDYCQHASTCVMMVSDDADVEKSIYGGCNVADVTNHTYIGIKRGEVNAKIFGGNNVAGDVPESHIDIFGSDAYTVTVNGEVYGGGNGSYTYTTNDGGGFDVTVSSEEGNIDYIGVTSRPYTEKTNIRVGNTVVSDADATAVTINGNIFGGGLAGGARETLVDINAPAGVFNCMIFGGGKGITQQIGNKNSSFNGYRNAHGDEGTTRHHAGNIHSHSALAASTNVHIKQMKDMYINLNSKRKAVFGGGYSGDVDGDTYVKLYSTNKATIPAVYLGGVAADVTGTATGLFDGGTLADDNANNVDTIYGGNDFTGKVYATDITINSGTYQHVFGAGNGDYTYKDVLSLTSAPNEEQQSAGYCTTVAADGRYWKFGCGDDPIIDTVPYSMKVDVVYNGGTFRGNVYGGGNLGLVGNRDMNPGNMSALNTSRYADLGHIHVVINNGNFKRHVYGGARGKSRLKDRFFRAKDWDNTLFAAAHTGESNPPSSIGVNIDGSHLGRHLVYGLKQIDMYGGEVFFSLHGGSESVDDGYPFECIGTDYDNTNYYKNLGYDDLDEGVVHRQKYGVGTDLLNPNSTLRPSSIVNVVGGHIRKSLYGGGYQGNIYGSVYVNIGAQAVKDSPVWTRFASMRIDDNEDNTIGSMKPDDALLVPNPLKPLKLDASVYNCADWGEAGDKAYFNTRGVFGGETNIIIDGEGYNTTGAPTYSGNDPEMNIAFSVIGTGTSTEGGDINRLIVMRNYGSYICPKPLKSLYSIQRADKVVLDKVYINLYGEQDAFESYASPNFSLNRLDTLALCNDNVLNIESPANYIGLHASMKGIDDVYHLYNINGNSPNLVTNTAVSGIAQAEQNLASNDILDNQVGPTTCGGSTNQCDLMDVCALVPTNRGDRGRPGKFNTIIVDEGSYMKISPFVDIWDMRNAVDANGDGDYDDVGDVAPIKNKRDGVDDNDDALSTNEHDYGHVFGYTYLVAPLETMGYVYGDYKYGSHNSADGGFVSPCTCNNIGDYSNEIDYLNVTNSGPYRTWKIGTANGLRKRNATLIANKEPDNILNWPLSAGNYATDINGSADYPLPGSNFAYATAAIELPPAKKGNFYVVESIDIDQANGGEMHLIDEGYEAITNTIFQAPGLTNSQSLEVISSGNEDVHNITFGLTMSGVKPTNGGRVTNFANDCWIDQENPLTITLPNENIRTIGNSTDHCWPRTGISGGTYFTNIDGYISNAVKSANEAAIDGILPRLSFTLTYDTRISNTIARDVKFRMLEYDKDGHYVGPIDVTVTINTVIRNFSDIEAPVLAMYNEGVSSEYVRRVNIPASFMQRDLYLEDIKWERNTDERIPDDRFYLQGMGVDVTQSNQFAIQVSPVEMVSNTLNNHLGWYDIVEENRYIDLYQAALDDLNRRTGSSATSMSTDRSANYTSWNINANSSTGSLEEVEEHYNGTMPTYGHDDYTGNTWGDVNGSHEWYDDRISSTSLHGREGIKLGTLDGRAPATLDVTLKYNGNLTTYHDHFANDDPGPLAWAYLKLHWYNTNTEEATGPDDGIFWVKVKLRTREKGDTIYMAPGTTLARKTTEGHSSTMNYWYDSPERIQNNVSLASNATHIRNNPNMYVRNFQEALSPDLYQEGDVIDIMETIEIDDNSPRVGNSDHVGIQIIRYSGSHYKFPSLGCANPHTLVKVNNGGSIAFRNITFNGSGATRVKKKESTHHTNYQDSVTVISGGQGQSGQYYNASADRVKAIYFAQSPILHCDDGGMLSLNEKVSLINNFNNYHPDSTLKTPGGAIAVTNGGFVNMGDNTEIRDNLVVERATVDNYGGAVYVDGGVLTVGPQVEDAACYIDIQHNYYYKGIGSNVLNYATAPAGFTIADEHAYKIDTAASSTLASNFSLSNVYLKRTPFSDNTLASTTDGMNASDVAAILKVRDDNQGDRILFTGALSDSSRIGVSKWFPGYRYTSTGTNDRLNNTVPRDTVSIAVLTRSTKGVMAQRNFANKVFFNDSNYFAQTTGDRSFNTDDNYTEYHTNSTAFPNYNDQVYTFYHNYVNDKTIYLQRCASFGKGVSQRQLTYTIGGHDKQSNDYKLGDSISFRMNPDATCMAITDTIIFKVGGGFFPYTYHWDYDSVKSGTSFTNLELYRKGVRDRQTYDPNSISNFDVTSYAAKRLAAENDTLVLYALEERQNELLSTYFFQATANDATGNCSVTQPIMVRVVKNLNNNTIPDTSNFLMHGVTYKVGTPGVDSSAFHDHQDHVPNHLYYGDRQTPTGTTPITPTYKVRGTSGWETVNSDSYASYSDNKVPRYMRTYLSFQLSPQVMPVKAQSDITVKAYPSTTGGPEINLDEARFCPGSIVYLTPRAKPTSVIDVNINGIVDSLDNNWEYMSWNFNPSSGRNTVFTVGTDAESNKPTIYYSPGDYWWQVVNTYYNDNVNHGDHAASKLDYETDYYGNVTIKSKKGLAWLISRVNGYNGQSARTFHFNTITIDPELDDDVLDMQKHKWTPLGNQNNPFEGTFVGNDRVISNIIVNEPTLPLVGMFGYIDSAKISDFTLKGIQLKGNSYVGSLAAHSHAGNIASVEVPDGIIFSEYVVGGLIGKDESTYFNRVEVSDEQDSGYYGKSGGAVSKSLQVKGNAIYFGGICGQAINTTIRNSIVNEINQKYLSALYSGPIVGSSETPSKRKARKDGQRTTVENCYAHIKSTGNAQRLGGLVGRAESINMANCYVYGEAKATDFTGALAGYVGSNVSIDHCYYVNGLSNRSVGSGTSSSVHNSTTFQGNGTQVMMNERIDGYNNLVRALNGWVNRQEDTNYLHWRPAIGLENSGYPLFGNQVMIPVYDTLNVAACDSYDFDGITLTQSGSYVMHFVDEADYLDSTVTLMLTINYSDSVEVIDTVLLGHGYEGYGISLTAEEVSAAFGNDHSVDIRTMLHIDSLLNAHGCDSLIILTLYIVNENVDINSQISTLSTDVKIYPNPTRGMVTVEGNELLSVEVYDNISRRILTRTSDGKENTIRFDMSQQAAGSYYIRVKTNHGTVVKKLIKK